MERLLREHLPAELSAEAIEELADELRRAARKIDERPKSFDLRFPDTCSERDVVFVTRQVERIVEEMMEVIKGEEGEIFNLIIRYHLLLHEARRRLGH